MMHPTEGQLKAYSDNELTEADLARMQAHIKVCSSCRERLKTFGARASQVQVAMATLDPTPFESAPSGRLARTHYESYTSQKEKKNMIKKIFTPRLRVAWAILVVTVILAAFIAAPPLRAIASDFLGLFRVQQVSTVPFDPLNLPSNFNIDQPYITELISENMKIQELGTAQKYVTQAEASRLAGISVRLPTALTSTPVLSVQPGARLDFKVDLPRIQSIVNEAGFGDIQLPEDLDGATVKAELPMIITAMYGDYQQTEYAAGKDPDAGEDWCIDCTVLVQLASPTISTPEGLDLTAIGKAYLRLTGMTTAEAESFSQTVDWYTTLVIPVPNYASQERVSVDGVTGVLIQNNEYDDMYMLIWAKDGLVYALTGSDSRQKALEIANSLR